MCSAVLELEGQLAAARNAITSNQENQTSMLDGEGKGARRSLSPLDGDIKHAEQSACTIVEPGQDMDADSLDGDGEDNGGQDVCQDHVGARDDELQAVLHGLKTQISVLQVCCQRTALRRSDASLYPALHFKSAIQQCTNGTLC